MITFCWNKKIVSLKLLKKENVTRVIRTEQRLNSCNITKHGEIRKNKLHRVMRNEWTFPSSGYIHWQHHHLSRHQTSMIFEIIISRVFSAYRVFISPSTSRHPCYFTSETRKFFVFPALHLFHTRISSTFQRN